MISRISFSHYRGDQNQKTKSKSLDKGLDVKNESDDQIVPEEGGIHKLCKQSKKGAYHTLSRGRYIVVFTLPFMSDHFGKIDRAKLTKSFLGFLIII